MVNCRALKVLGFIMRLAVPHLGGGTGYNCPGRQYFGGAEILWSEIKKLIKIK